MNPEPIQASICAACMHCRKPTDTFGARAVTWRCAAAEPYSSTPGHRNPLTGKAIAERVVLIPCSWQNEGECDLYERGAPGSTGEVTYPNPNSLLWAQRKRDELAAQEAEQNPVTITLAVLVAVAAMIAVYLALWAIVGVP